MPQPDSLRIESEKMVIPRTTSGTSFPNAREVPEHSYFVYTKKTKTETTRELYVALEGSWYYVSELGKAYTP